MDARTWQDPWFHDLSLDSKVLFIFLVTNANNAGVVERSMAQIEFETGIRSGHALPAMEHLFPKVEWWPTLNYAFVVNHLRYQGATTNLQNYVASARKAIAGAPELVRKRVHEQYPELVDAVPMLPKKVTRKKAAKPNDLTDALLDKLKAKDARWAQVTYSSIQKLITKHGYPVVIRALQNATEGSADVARPYMYLTAICREVDKQEEA